MSQQSNVEKVICMSEMLIGTVFKLEYSLKYNEETKLATELGYFHGMERLVVAADVHEAVKTLNIWHTDGKPEAIKATNLGSCIKKTHEP